MKRLLIVTLRVAVFVALLLTLTASPVNEPVHDDTEWPCPPGCLDTEYGSFWWYMTCWPLPATCSASGPGGGSSGGGSSVASIARGVR